MAMSKVYNMKKQCQQTEAPNPYQQVIESTKLTSKLEFEKTKEDLMKKFTTLRQLSDCKQPTSTDSSLVRPYTT